MFNLVKVEYSTPHRLTLFFTDTVSTTASANTTTSNYLINGGASTVGNFIISGSTVSFDIKDDFEGQLYDIQLYNIENAQGDIINPFAARASFYFGSGVITPLLIQDVGSFKAFITNDSALVGGT